MVRKGCAILTAHMFPAKRNALKFKFRYLTFTHRTQNVQRHHHFFPLRPNDSMRRGFFALVVVAARACEPPPAAAAAGGTGGSLAKTKLRNAGRSAMLGGGKGGGKGSVALRGRRWHCIA